MAAAKGHIGGSAARAARDLRVVFSRLRRRFKDAAGGHELTPSQVAVLSRLGKAGVASASDLAAAEGVRPQAVAPILMALEQRELIQRRPDPDDGRRQLVSLTPAGRALLDDGRRAGEEWLARALQEHYTEAERQTLIKAIALLERLSPS
jgi:DNA-binding MarR family transcriptional regulator